MLIIRGAHISTVAEEGERGTIRLRMVRPTIGGAGSGEAPAASIYTTLSALFRANPGPIFGRRAVATGTLRFSAAEQLYQLFSCSRRTGARLFFGQLVRRMSAIPRCKGALRQRVLGRDEYYAIDARFPG
jgi:hypothetical protein